MAMKKNFLEVRGNNYERAFQQGTAYQAAAADLLETIRNVLSLESPIYKFVPLLLLRTYINYIGNKYYRLHKPLLQDYFGVNIVDFVDGLRDGFKESEDFLYGINAVEIIASEIPFSMGCSSFAFAAEATKDGRPKIAYNHDFPSAFGKHLFVRRSIPDVGYRALSLCYPPIIGSIGGINEKGLAISLNHAYTTDMFPNQAIPITLLVQQCLNRCADVKESLELIKKTPVPNGSILTLIDISGKRVAVELSCSEKGYRYAKGPIMHSFNKYQVKEMEKYEIPLQAKAGGVMKGFKVHDHNIGREERYQQIKNVTKIYRDQDIHNLLADHNEGEGSALTICRHHSKTGDTLAASILDPGAKQIKVILGFPCQGKFETYKLF